VSDLPTVDNNFVYTVIAVLGAIGSAWLTHQWDSKREKQKDEIEEERKNRIIRKAIYLELKFYDEQFEKLYNKENSPDTKVVVQIDSEEARRFDNLSDPSRMQYEKMAPESIVGALEEEEILDELRYAYDAIHSFFEKYPFELTLSETMEDPRPSTRYVEKDDIAFVRLKIANGIEKVKKYDEKMPASSSK
jgi:hypothetical protein